MRAASAALSSASCSARRWAGSGFRSLALQADRRLLQVDQHDAGTAAQNILGGGDHAADAGMLVQRDPHRHRLAKQRPQPVEVFVHEQRERRHLERFRAARLLRRRQRHFGELDVAGRAPRQNLAGLAVRQLVERALGEAAERSEVARAQLLNAAAMGRAAHDLIADAERIHDIERKKRDVRRLEHVAAGVEDEIGAGASGRGARCVLPEPRQQRVVELNARHRMTSRATLRKPSTPPRRSVTASFLARAMAARAMARRKRGLTP